MTAVLDGKVALVTGGSRGIGAAVALRLAEDGADVALTYLGNAERAAGVVDRIKALGRRGLAVQADSADPAAVRAAVDLAAAEFGRLDILVNNAGIGVLGPVEDMSVADVDRVLEVNVRAPFLAVQAVLRHMAEGGRIITVGSCMSERSAFAGGSLYGMSKSALNGLIRSLARELGPRGITANLVQPGPIDTGMNPADGPAGELQAGLTALGRFGTPPEVAAMVAHLAGEGGRYVTGSAILVDGGYAA
ncbi:3-oxoacyl-ACP reductase [Kitasatospora herbaricolor]|uniref:SDR family NAD(P)-dependent oxidoreductase n=1 Tax=Kitasatospora herbaricolor TaxID=68217 RepID=UPI0017487DD9|nr:3-oxoacyl-ACP reductase family protein [Kitasatospora herbaricolor]MDQ0313055.1 NAD(P)-dependent dehydrogenase (short-subunit alcohol dehydrogenase family) [Kitasatospora herbaricolor]GGV24488.1 3-oxoacyl-ACP reductase [Kitasatospora herbaricolor]